MADLIIDYSTLQASSDALTSIDNEFNQLKGHEQDLTGSWGSGDIAHAMDDFAGNWDYHRHKIMAAIESLNSMTATTMKAFSDADDKLKKGLTQQPKNGKG